MSDLHDEEDDGIPSHTVDDVYDEVQDSAVKVGRIDERTQNIERQMDSLMSDVEKNKHDIDSIETSVKRNTTIINGVTIGMSAVLLWLAEKVGAIF